MVIRKLPAVLVLFAIVGLAFGTGYISYPLFHSDQGTSSPGEQESPTDPVTPVDMQSFWEVWHLLERDFYGAQPDDTDRLYGSVRGLVDVYGDPYTVFVEPQPRELERDELRGSYGGIGAFLEWTESGYRLRPIPDQPAALAGVLEGDLLLVVDDQEITADMSEDEVVALVRGPVGSEVVLILRREETTVDGAGELSVRMTRTAIETPSVAWHLLDDRPETATIGYIQQYIFSERSPAEMKQAIEELRAAGAERFILDLRGNPGGLVDSAIAVAGAWLDGGLLLVEERADGTRKDYTAAEGALVEANRPLVVLVDAGTASAAEIVAGALQDRQRALLVGETTFGKGSVQLIHELIDESSLHVTTAVWFTPNGHAINGTGLTPDIVVESGADPLSVAIEAVQAEGS